MADIPHAIPIKIEKRDTAIIAQPQMKNMDEDQIQTMGRLIEESSAPNSGITVVIVDLCHVSMLPSVGLGLLVQISNKCKSRQQKLRLAALQPPVRRVLAITRLDRVFELSPSVEAALQ